MGSFNASLKTFGDSKGLPATVELDQGRLRIAAGDADIGDWPLDEISLEPVPNGYRLAAEGEQLFLEMPDREQFADELSQASKKKLTLNGPQMPRLKAKRGEKKKLTLNGPQMPRLKAKRGERKKGADAEHLARPLETPAHHAEQVETPTNVPVATEAPTPTPPVEAKSPKAVDETASRSTKKKKKKKKKKRGSLLEFLVAQLDRTIDTSEKRWGSLLPGWVFNRIVFVQAAALLLLAIAFPGPASTVLLVAGLAAVMVGGAAYTDDVLASKLLPGRTTATHVLVLGVALLGLGLLAGFVSR